MRPAAVPANERTIPALLMRAAEVLPSKTFLLFGDSERSYAETCERAAAYAGTLATAGVERGDRVAIMARNSLEFVDLWLGCAWGGVIMVPINVSSRGSQLEHVLANARPRIMVIEQELLKHLAFIETLPATLKRVWVLSGAPSEARVGTGQTEPFPAPGTPVPAQPVGPGDTAAILYTGGTTGPSKGVCCPHAQCYWWGVNVGGGLLVDEDSVLYTVLPLFHTNGLNTLSQALVHGATFAFGQRFSASRFWEEVRVVGATQTYLLGAMVSILLKQPESSHDRQHSISRALAPGAPREAIEEFEARFNVRLVQGFGSTETNSVMSNQLGPYKVGAMGSLRAGFDARVVDDDDVEVEDATPGELILRHSEPFSFATGYWDMPESTVAAWRNLWFHTGDRVVRDSDGVFWFKDRIKDVIRRRGENISSYEVEQVLEGNADVTRAAVVPVPSELAEDDVFAFVVLREGAKPDPVGLIRYCEPRLAYFAIPRYFEFVSELPLTEVGRVKKYVLRERGLGEATWDREAVGVVLRRT